MPDNIKQRLKSAVPGAQYLNDSIEALLESIARQPVQTTPNLFTWMTGEALKKLDVLEASFRKTNLQETAEEDNRDPQSLMIKTTQFALQSTRSFTREALSILRSRMDVQSLACCLINSLAQIDQVDQLKLSRQAREGLLANRRILVVMKVMLETMRNIARQGLKSYTLEISFNFIKSALDGIFTMFAGLFFVVVSNLRFNLISKITSELRRYGGSWLNCFGLLNLLDVFIRNLFGQSGFFWKLRSVIYSLLLRQRKELADTIQQTTYLSWLKWLDIMITVVNSLIVAIDTYEFCAPRKTSNQSAKHNNFDITNERETDDDEDRRKRTRHDESVTLPGFETISVSADRVSYGVPIVDATQLFNGPSPTELERFLTVYLNVPQSEARAAVQASHSGNCMDRLSAEESQRVREILNNLGI